MAKKKSTRVLKVRPRCAGTMTESAFWAFIRAALRQKSRYWKPISIVKIKSRRAYAGVGKRQKFEYQCNYCKKWFPEKKINVDHINPAGTLTCANDLPGFAERLFCEPEGLQTLCENCHSEKTKNESNRNK